MFDNKGYLSWKIFFGAALLILLLAVGTRGARAEESVTCKLPVQESMMEEFKSKNDKYNVFYSDKKDVIVDYLNIITEVRNPGKDISQIKQIHESLKKDFGKLFVYVNKSVSQMMVWVEDTKGCYMGHGKHPDIWQQVQDRIKGI